MTIWGYGSHSERSQFGPLHLFTNPHEPVSLAQ